MFVGLAVGVVPMVVSWVFPVVSGWEAMAVGVGCIPLGSRPGVRGGIGEVVLCMSSMRLTLEVLDLVFIVGAGDGEMGGDGESSPTIVGIGSAGGPAVLLALRMDVWAAFRVGGVPPYSSTRDSVSSSCGVSGWVLDLG